MEVIFSSKALREVVSAARYYEVNGVGLGDRFFQNLSKTVNDIKEFPLAARVLKNEFRRRLIDHFPYGIIYRVDGSVIFIAAVMHLKKKPDYWE